MFKFNGKLGSGHTFSGKVNEETFPAAMESLAQTLADKMEPEQVAGIVKLTVQLDMVESTFGLREPKAAE